MASSDALEFARYAMGKIVKSPGESSSGLSEFGVLSLSHPSEVLEGPSCRDADT